MIRRKYEVTIYLEVRMISKARRLFYLILYLKAQILENIRVLLIDRGHFARRNFVDDFFTGKPMLSKT